jgi:hypothetical protein
LLLLRQRLLPLRHRGLLLLLLLLLLHQLLLEEGGLRPLDAGPHTSCHGIQCSGLDVGSASPCYCSRRATCEGCAITPSWYLAATREPCQRKLVDASA